MSWENKADQAAGDQGKKSERQTKPKKRANASQQKEALTKQQRRGNLSGVQAVIAQERPNEKKREAQKLMRWKGREKKSPT